MRLDFNNDFFTRRNMLLTERKLAMVMRNTGRVDVEVTTPITDGEKVILPRKGFTILSDAMCYVCDAAMEEPCITVYMS